MNEGSHTLNLRGITLDDKKDSGSKEYVLGKDVFLKPKEKIKFYKSETKISLDNS